MTVPSAELERRFQHHPPKSRLTADLHQDIRDRFLYMAESLNAIMPDGRESALCLTNLEEAMFWANAAVARNQS